MRGRRVKRAYARQFFARDYRRLLRKAATTREYAASNPTDESADDRSRKAYVDLALASEFYPKEVVNGA